MIFKLISESFLFALSSLITDKLRTFLSLLGIVIGIFSIILVLTAVDSLEENIESSIDSLGSDVVFVSKWPWDGMGSDYPWWKYLSRPNPSEDELDYIRERSEAIGQIAFRSQITTTIKHKDQFVESVDIQGVTYEFRDVWNLAIEKGRYFTEMEGRMGKNVMIMGSGVAEAMFPRQNPVDKMVTARGRKFQVIGVLKREGEGILGGFNDNAVFIPLVNYKTIANLNNPDLFSEILVKAKPGITNAQLKDELTGIMRAVRRIAPGAENDFSLNETSILSNSTKQIFAILNIVGWIIGGFSIFIGGFGIANIMFVSVKERTQLIGIQKAIGAKRYFILIQFLTESLVLSLMGCVVGLVLVYLVTLFSGSFISFKLILHFNNVMVGVIISTIVGLLAGIVPAYTAARLDPVEAIRSK